MKQFKLYVDANRAPEGWIHVKDFDEFKMMLETLNYSQISAISFNFHLGFHEENSMDGGDCALLLVEHAKGSKLPQCYTHTPGNLAAARIIETIGHYNKSYGYDNDCLRMITEKVGIS